jgi:Ser/Thr protein kinase RdoA (MazF antagonist)
VDTTGLALDDRWSRPEGLLAAANRWLDAVAPDLPRTVTSTLRSGLLRVVSALTGRPAGLVHGDFVPVNLLVREDRVVALLDLEAVRIGEPLLDAAWFEWILRHHHPEVADEAARAFAEWSGLDRTDGSTATLLAGLPAITILEILDRAAPAPAARLRWLEQLRRLANTLGS